MHSIAGTVPVHDVRHILLVLNVFAVNGNDEVAAQHDLRITQVGALGAAM